MKWWLAMADGARDAQRALASKWQYQEPTGQESTQNTQKENARKLHTSTRRP